MLSVIYTINNEVLPKTVFVLDAAPNYSIKTSPAFDMSNSCNIN